MNIGDVLIHINESLNAQQRSTLEEAVRDIDGVIAPRFNQERSICYWLLSTQIEPTSAFC